LWSACASHPRIEWNMTSVTAELTVGSLWRRWEPHVHLPGTLHEDRYNGMTIEEAWDELGSRSPRIESVGVTDYFTTRTFRAADAAWKAGRPERDVAR
jgi:hypothetical protein